MSTSQLPVLPETAGVGERVIEVQVPAFITFPSSSCWYVAEPWMSRAPTGEVPLQTNWMQILSMKAIAVTADVIVGSVAILVAGMIV